MLPSGRAVTLSGGLANLIGGLGATFGGSVTKDFQSCYPVSFQIFHATPGDLFQTYGASAVPTPTFVSPALAKVGVDGLKGSPGRLVILSTGEWTLVAAFRNDPPVPDNVLLGHLNGWRLRSTPSGAVLNVPADSTVSGEVVALGRTPDLTDREVIIETGCPQGGTKAHTLNESATHGGWCEHGFLVEIDGPESYVGVAVADLKVQVARTAQ